MSWQIRYFSHQSQSLGLCYCASPKYETPLSYDKHDLSVEPGTKMVGCNETALYFDSADDTAYALTRTNPICVILGRSQASDYQEWEWRDVKVGCDGDGILHKPEEVKALFKGSCLPEVNLISHVRSALCHESWIRFRTKLSTHGLRRGGVGGRPVYTTELRRTGASRRLHVRGHRRTLHR